MLGHLLAIRHIQQSSALWFVRLQWIQQQTQHPYHHLEVQHTLC
jgi:hypothetical protein